MSLNPPIRDWYGKRVWIIGASTGIGAALAQRLARAGARLALSARSHDKLAALASAYATIVAKWGGADVTLFNAGTYSPMSAAAFDLAHMNEHFAVNYHGVTNGLAAILPDYLERAASHPCIAIVSSVAGLRGLPLALAYGPSKAALINLAETLYLDLAPKGIAVTVINPGFAAGEFEMHFPKRFTRWLHTLRLLPYTAYFALIGKAVKP